MKRALTTAATLTLLMTSALGTSQSPAPGPVTMPEVQVTAEPEVRQHPQDPSRAEDRLPGCVEVITPSTGGELSGSHQAKYAKAGIAVMPDMNNPRSIRDTGRNDAEPEPQAFAPGWTSSVPQCPDHI